MDITFAQASLGMTLSKDPKSGLAVVSKVEPNSEAARAGVKAGFRVVGLEGSSVASYDAFMAVVQTVARPCLIRFEADAAPAAAPSAAPKGKGGGLFKKAPVAEVVSPEEAASRRRRSRRWDKR